MTRLESQIRELSPSVKDALFRRLTFAEDLAWLRDEKRPGCVIGFEVDLEDQELSGFSLIAIQRHTVIAYVSDRDESPRLILFPSLETLFDPGFELLDLIVTRKEFSDGAFKGLPSGHGRFGDMVKDLTPPSRKMDLSDTVVEQITAIVGKEADEEEEEVKQPVTAAPMPTPPPVKPIEEPVDDFDEEPAYEEGPPEDFDDGIDSFDEYEEPGYDDYDDYEEPGYADSYDEAPPALVKEPTRSEQLKAETFQSLNEVIDFVVLKLGINRPIAVTLANKAMQSKVSPEYRVQLAVNIFCKLLDENRL